MGGVVVDQLILRFSIRGSVPEIFAIKVESFREQAFQKLYPGSRHVVWIKICDDIPISPEVIDVHTLNFKPNFKFSRLIFLGGPPSQLGCALGSLGQSLALVKISERNTP